jgi:hypothetical protein
LIDLNHYSDPIRTTNLPSPDSDGPGIHEVGGGQGGEGPRENCGG